MSNPDDFRQSERREGWAVPLDAVSAFIQGASVSVAPDRIEQELVSLWRRASERAAAEGAAFAVTRACQWNLLVHTHGESELLTMKQVLDTVSETVPSRILVLHEGDTSADGSLIGDDGAALHASVEANFRQSHNGRREFVAEEITIETPQLHSRRLPSLVRSLLLPDVPTALLVHNPALDADWLRPLCADADRFIFDSGRLRSGTELAQMSQVFAELWPDREAQVELMDLGWLRLWPWRLLLSSLYDSPASRQGLPQLYEIEVGFSAGAQALALLLSGWLLGRLHLAQTGTLEEDGTVALLPAAGSVVTRPVRLLLRARDNDCAKSGIASVTLRHAGYELSATGTACGDGIELRSPFQPPRTQPLRGRPDPELLVAALGVGGRDPLMYEALQLGAALLLGDAMLRAEKQLEVRW